MAKETGKDIPNQMQSSRDCQGDIGTPSQVNNAKKHEKIEWERLEISSRKLEIPREHFMQ